MLFNLRETDPASLLACAQSEEFAALATLLPCLIRASDAALEDEELGAEFEKAGFRQIQDEQVFPTELPPHGKLPPQAQWAAGNWYMAPPVKPSSAQAASRALALALVQLVMADADTHEIEALFRRDPALSYHLLRLVNSLGIGMGKKIASFAQAIVILGRQQLRRWLNLMLFSARDGDQRSAMLLARVAMRARKMELLAKASGLDRAMQELAFMGGMFSLLGVLFGQPLSEILKPLSISDALSSAVLEHTGELGQLLTLIEASENDDPATADALLNTIQVAAHEFNRLTIDAHLWMLSIVRESQG